MGVAAEISTISEGRLGRPWLLAPRRRLCLVRHCVAVRLQGVEAGDLSLPIPAARVGTGSLRLVFVAPSHHDFPCGFGVTIFFLRGKEEFITVEWWISTTWCEFISLEGTELVVSSSY